MLDPKGIDFVVPLGPGSKFKNCELRYCLRSLEKFGKGIRRVVIVGDDPGFLSDKVTVLKSPKFDFCKEARIATKVQWAFENSDLSDNILFANDDYFFIAPFDARKVPFYQRGSLFDSATRVKCQLGPGESWKLDSYQKVLQTTHDALAGAGKPAHHYDIHYPIVYNRKFYCETLRPWWEASAKSPHGYAAKSTYSNNFLPTPGPLFKDLKLQRYFGEADVAKRIAAQPDRFCISYGDQALYEGFEQWLYDRFPNPSQFESCGA